MYYVVHVLVSMDERAFIVKLLYFYLKLDLQSSDKNELDDACLDSFANLNLREHEYKF